MAPAGGQPGVSGCQDYVIWQAFTGLRMHNSPPGTAPEQDTNDPVYTQSLLTGRFNTTINMILYKKILINYKTLILIHLYLWIKIVQFNNNPTNKAL